MNQSRHALGPMMEVNDSETDRIVQNDTIDMEEHILLTKALGRFLNGRASARSFEGYPLSYDLVKQARATPWKLFIDDLISGDLNETINLLNSWCRRLMDWQTWLTVLPHYSFNDAWTIQDQFLDPLMFQCLSQPSATRDRMATIATNAVHQTFRCMDGTYLDVLDGDRNPGRPLGRTASEKQLERLGKPWVNYRRFGDALGRMDTPDYRTATRNFRNLSHHGIAPRIGHGVVNFVVRSIVAKTSMEQGQDGLYFPVAHPSEKCVQYGYGPTPALDSSEIFHANRAQWCLAVVALKEYEKLLRELIAAPRPKADLP